MKKLSLFLILILSISIGVFGVISGNWSDEAYNVDNTTGNSFMRNSTPSIKVLVIMGAGNFLKSHSDFQLFLNKIELFELYGADFVQLQYILNAAVNSIESANVIYFNLKNLAAATPYNQQVIEQLKIFDYDNFLEEKGLNAKIFQKVKGFLSRGDVTGAYESMFLDTVDLLERLNQIKLDIDKGTIPDISKIWELNQEYSDTLFFGQYTAAIFFEIHGIIKYKY